MAHRTGTAILLVVVASACFLVPQPARAATTWVFPGCNGAATLQACIDAAAPGDTVQIGTDTPIDESPSIDKSLTLEAAPGFHPSTTSGISVFADSGTIAVTLTDLAFGDGIEGRFIGGSGHSLTVRGVTVTNPSDGSAWGIYGEAAVPAMFDIRDSSFHVGGHQEPQMRLYSHPASGVATYRIVGNRLSGNGAVAGGGGVEFSMSGAGATHAIVHNNSIWQTGSCDCGLSPGIGVDLSGPATGTVDIVGNTSDHSASNGLGVRNSLEPGGHVALTYFDNVVSSTGRGAINLDDVASTLTVQAGYNDVFREAGETSWGGYDPGPGNLFVKPKYVDVPAGDLRLAPVSPLIDAGLLCPPGGLSNPDAAGHTRVAGSGVDMGAFEAAAGPVTGVVRTGTSAGEALTGTSGGDVLCGMGGVDELNGGGGADHLGGGPGADLVAGGGGGDVAHGGPGADRVQGGPGADKLFGDEGPDAVLGGPGADSVAGGTGDDPCLVTRDGVHGNDHLNGGIGSDGFRADPGDLVTQAEHPATCT